MTRKLTVLLSILFLMAVLMTPVIGEEKAKEEKAAHDFVGAKKCKICHKKDGTFPSWSETPHAKAFEQLPEDQRENKECMPCHATGVTKKGETLEGVQCEACHGAGADYKKKKTMEDRELAVAAGLLIPDENTCKSCHEGKVPEGHKELAKFDFATMKEKGVHSIPEKK